MRVPLMQVQCDNCCRLTGTYDMTLMSLGDVLLELKECGWYRSRGSRQDLCPICNEKRLERGQEAVTK